MCRSFHVVSGAWVAPVVLTRADASYAFDGHSPARRLWSWTPASSHGTSPRPSLSDACRRTSTVSGEEPHTVTSAALATDSATSITTGTSITALRGRLRYCPRLERVHGRLRRRFRCSGDEVRLVDVSLSVIRLSCLNHCGQVMTVVVAAGARASWTTARSSRGQASKAEASRHIRVITSLAGSLVANAALCPAQ